MEKRIRTIIESSTKIAVFGHKNPDGDSIGGLLGLGRLLEKMGKKVSYFTPTPPSKIYNFLPDIKKVSSKFDYGTYDILVFLDFSELNRLGVFYDENPKYFDTHTIVGIDHHVCKGGNEHRHQISDSTAMSSCELLFENTYNRWPDLYDNRVATYLYLGLSTDSGNFRYDEDHKRILRNALGLVTLGADKKLIINNMFRRKSFAGLKMMQLMFRRLKKKGGLVYTRYTEKDLAKLDLDREEADFGQMIIQDIDDADVSVVFKCDEKVKECSISFRSKHMDVQKIAETLGGGGHLHAAGCTIAREGTFQDQVEVLSTKIANMVKHSK